MLVQKIKYKNVIAVLVIYWSFISITAYLSRTFEINTLTEWWMNTISTFILIYICLATAEHEIKKIYIVLSLPLFWIVHVVLTIPAAIALGIIMKDPDHIRSVAEHRAVFILAALPIIFFVIIKSRLFVESVQKKDELAMNK